ncbi:MAG TPA: PspC domain-containing protein [Bacteroidales bacterium]|nr:PspC domain-containing protein [Bacteroidales bacterium]
MSKQRLYRSKTSRVIGGVSGGIGEFFDIDPVIIRIVFVLLTIFGGSGILIYFIMWIVVPDNPSGGSGFASSEPYTPQDAPEKEEHTEDQKFSRRSRGSLIGGTILIGIGSLVLADRFFPNFYFSDFWPVVLIAVGVVLIVNALNRKNTAPV